ncbi:MAG: glycosyltransferase family protein [Candidatus Nanoarchaeia archaeon]
MKILYGVCGEGFGHSSRALVIASYLEKQGHEVIIMTYGQAYKVLKKRFKIFKIRGLSLIFEKNILKKRKTLAHNLNSFPKNLWRWKRFHKLMKEFNPDLCITDMEPIIPILRYWYKKPLICIDNQHRMTNLKIDVPAKYNPDFLLARNVTNAFVGKADYFIITSFSNAKIKKQYKNNTFIVSPIIRDEVNVVKNKVKYGDNVLVYLTKKNKNILKTLKKLDCKFIVYGYNKNYTRANLQFKTRESFLNDLVNCKAIIASSGFTLMSEAIFLKKPYLALPLAGQFEQMLNALFLHQAKFGTYSLELKEKDILDFLNKLKEYKKNLKKYNFDNDKLFKTFNYCLNNLKK